MPRKASRSRRLPTQKEKPASKRVPGASAGVRGRQTVALTVNGKWQEHAVEPRRLLVDFLRDELKLKGSHVGCDTSQCGACTVLVGGRPVKSCTMFAVQADGSEILTIEGLSDRGEMHPLQRAFKEHQGLQCGYCTPAMVLSAYAFLREHPTPSEDEIRVAISGNLCRCTGYQAIVDSVASAARDSSRA